MPSITWCKYLNLGVNCNGANLLSFYRVWDWKANMPLSVIENHNPQYSRITDMKFINEEDVALLLTASGNVLLFYLKRLRTICTC